MVLFYGVTFLTKIALCYVCIICLLFIATKASLMLFDFTCRCRADLTGKTIIITGGNSGIGLETAKGLARRGARLVIASRNVAKSQAAVQAIIDETGNHKVEHKFLDLGKFSSIKQFADDFNKSYDRLDVLINNSGTNRWEQYLTEDGIDELWQINHVGPTYLTKLLLDKIIASKPSRIIFVAAVAFKCHMFDPADVTGVRKMNKFIRYANTKFANILIARALSKILPEGVTVNALHPGTGATDIFDVKPEALKKYVFMFLDWFQMSVEECAQASIHLASAPSLAGVSGQYFDEFRLIDTHKDVTDELAERVFKNIMNLIEDKTKGF